MGVSQLYAQAPPNDNCSSAETIAISNGGFGLGNFASSQTNITNATVQTGESFAPAIFVAGLDDKSVWFKFSLPTIRAVRITLSQPGTAIAAGNVGFAVYKTDSCLPTNASISTKLTPIVTWGNTYHPCVPAGEYLVQVSSNTNANGPIGITVEVSDQTGAAYDHPNEAYAFGVASPYVRRIDFQAECQSIEDATEVCNSLSKKNEYHKSAWFTFTTPAYFDHLVVALAGTGATQYFPGGGANVLKKFGYNLYRGNAVSTPISSLALVDGCDSMLTNGYIAAKQVYRCGDLQPNTTYSIQLFIHKDFNEMLRLAILTSGISAPAGPLPVNTLPASNNLGVLPASGGGTTTRFTDYFGCSSSHSTNGCSPAKPAAGVTVNGTKYNLSNFASFRLNTTAAITFRPAAFNCGPRPVIRLFKQTLTGNCADLDTANIVGTAVYNGEIECLAPGDYVLQVLGVDAPSGNLNTLYSFDLGSNRDLCLFTNLGVGFFVDMVVFTRKAASKYSLNVPGAFDTINRVAGVQQPLRDGVTYRASPDTIGCQPTLRPSDTTCSPINDKVIYRQFVIEDSGTVDFSDLVISNNPPFRYKLYSGDANALATAQSVFNYPEKVNGLDPKSLCLYGVTYCTNKSVCVEPGTYTFASFGSVGDVGRADRPTFTFKKTRTQYNSLQNALNMGSIMDTLGPNGGTLRGKRDYWSCTDNAIPINGYTPCAIAGRPATKAIYRQFYLKEDAVVRFSNPGYGGWCVGQAYGTRTLFYGKATDGMQGLSPVGNQWNCFSTASTTNNCAPLEAGWYTVVSWGTGPNYDSTMRLTEIGGRYNGYVSYFDEFDITITPACPKPKFNRPHRASVSATSAPHLIQWGTRAISTPVYPRTDTLYRLPVENFNCTVDTPFSSHPIVACEAAANRVAYYVFRTTQVSFLQINTGGYFAALYDKDVRIDSLQFATAKPIQQCNSSIGNIQFCNFQPGTYTLVIFAKDANICRSVAPTIFIDRVGYSRFDFAQNAYDFGTVPPDSVYHFGKVGDVNPLHPSRPPSSDFIYCTTGAFTTDPTNTACDATVNGNIYSTAKNQPLYDSIFPASSGNISRRNLWYTFVVDHPGTVRIKVENKTLQRNWQPRFAVYSSDVDAALPFNAVQSGGQVDSTVASGLKFVTMNYITYYNCYNAPNNISFYRDPCSAAPTRYYILVDNVNATAAEAGGLLPNSQIDVSIQLDSFNLVLPKFDHYSKAGNIGTVGAGVHTGPQDNYSCATRSGDPLGSGQNGCSKTLWYKFNSTITGNVRFRIRIGNNVFLSSDDIQLFKEAIPGDSTSNGLKVQPAATVGSPTGNWSQTCVTTGTYYLLLPGCNRVNQYVTPEIELIEQEGDFCSRAVPVSISGAGNNSASVLVNCHTIGTDYGEFGNTLTCPQAGVTTQYKSSWFRMDIGGTDTLDVTTFLVENTNAASSDIKYRMMTGDCGAMQEQSCVLDALTQNTYECLVPGQRYYIQVFTPVLKNNVAVTGTIALQLSARKHADTCLPLNNCLATANFLPSFDCTKDESVKFSNFSTFGENITYQWNFGHNGATSTAVSPSYFYPALSVDSTYTIKLMVRNTACNKVDSSIRTFTVPARPFIDFGADIIQCNSTAPIVLRAKSHPGATYLWQNNSTADSFRVAATGSNDYRARVTYKGCVNADTVRVLISPISARPLQKINLCTDSVQVDVRRGFGETYRWNTGATTRSIFMSQPGYYWVDITYFDCVYRDSFEVNNVNAARPFGNDTTVCLSKGGFILDASSNGAISYRWQNNSTADTFLVTAAGQYRVEINFGNCTVRDTINILGYPPPTSNTTDTSICVGNTYTLPSGLEVCTAGIYRDTLKYVGGCDSLIRIVNLSVKAAPNIGKDTTLCVIPANFMLNASTVGALGYTWQDGSTASTFTVTNPGTYWVRVNHGSCTTTDSVNITLLSSPLLIRIDTSLCAGSSIRLPSGLVVQSTGIYVDTVVSKAGCDSLIRMYVVTVNSRPSLGADTTVGFCLGQSINLHAFYNTSGLNATWTINNQPVANPATVSVSGNYRLVVTNVSGCSDTAFVLLSITAKVMLGSDTSISICQGNFLNLQTAYNTPGLSAQWTTGGNVVANPTAVSIAGIYRLVATRVGGCSDTAFLTLSNSPKPNLGTDTTLVTCTGNSVNLTTVYNTTGLTTSWTNNGVAVANPLMVVVGGNYRVVARNSFGCSDTAFVALSLQSKPSLGNDQIQRICSGSSFNLTTAYATTGLTATWTLNGNPVAEATAVSNAGNYQLIVVNNLGCADTAILTLNVNPQPNLGNDITKSICSDSSVNLLSLFSTGTNSNVWTREGTVVINPTSVNAGGRYQLISTTTLGCADTAVVDLMVSTAPVVVINNPPMLCVPQTANLTNAAVTAGTLPGISFSYWANAMATVGLSNATVVTDGTYYIKGTNSTGCFSIMPVLVRSHPLPLVNAGPDKSICSNENSTTLSVQVSNTQAPVTYQWTPIANGGIVSPATASTIVRPTAARQPYIITVTDGSGCNYKVSDTVVVLKQPPVAAFAGNDTFAIMGQPIRLKATGGVAYSWSPANLLSNPAIANPLATINTDSVVFTVTVTDANGCKATDHVVVRTFKGGTYHVPNAFTPDRDGLNDVFRPIPMGINVSKMVFRVFNRFGLLMFETNLSMHGWDGNFKGEAQPAGNYVWRLQAETVTGKAIEMKGNVVLIR